MSNVSTRHSVIPFIAGKTEPLSGQRLAKIGYKQTEAMTKKGEIAPTSVCASIPFVSDAQIVENVSILIPLIRASLEDYQDKVIRGLYESRGAKPENLTSVSDEEISIGSIIGFMASESSGGRITREYLENWFTQVLGDSLTVAIAEKVGATEVDDVRVVQALAGYRGMISSVSGTKTLLGTAQIDQIRKVLALCGVTAEDDSTARFVIGRIDEMDKKNANLSALF